MCPFESAFLYPLDKFLVVQLLGPRVVLFLVFFSDLHTVLQFAFPPTVQKGSPFSTFLPTPVVSCVVNLSHSDRYEVLSHHGFDFYFPDDE